MWAPWSAKPTRSSPPPKKRVSFNLSPEQEAKSPTPHPRFSHDPPSLENSVETGISEIGQPLFNSSILSNNSEEHNLTLLNSLDSSQLRSTLEDVLQQNTSLKLEVENKARQLQTAKRQMKALIDLEPSMPEPTLSGNEETQFSLGCASKSCPIQNSINSMTKNVSELGQDEVIDNDSTESNSRRQSRNDYPIPGILPEHTFILIRGKCFRTFVNYLAMTFFMKISRNHVPNRSSSSARANGGRTSVLESVRNWRCYRLACGILD